MAGASTVDFVATLPTVSLHFQRPLWSRQIEKSNARNQSFRDSRRRRKLTARSNVRYGGNRVAVSQRVRSLRFAICLIQCGRCHPGSERQLCRHPSIKVGIRHRPSAVARERQLAGKLILMVISVGARRAMNIWDFDACRYVEYSDFAFCPKCGRSFLGTNIPRVLAAAMPLNAPRGGEGWGQG